MAQMLVTAGGATVDPTTRAPSSAVAGALRWVGKAVAAAVAGLAVKAKLDASTAQSVGDAVGLAVAGIVGGGLDALGVWARNNPTSWFAKIAGLLV